MFIGEYKHKMDKKRRMSLPSKFRQELGDKLFVTKGEDHCLTLLSLEDVDNAYGTTNPLSNIELSRKYNRFLYAGADQLEIDSAGRILIPERLANFADLKEDVILAGIKDRIEVWDESRWRDYIVKDRI